MIVSGTTANSPTPSSATASERERSGPSTTATVRLAIERSYS